MEGSIFIFPNRAGATLKGSKELSRRPERWNSLCRGGVRERFRVKTAEPEVVGQEKSQPRGFDYVCAPEAEPNKRQENESGECHSQKR